MGHKVHPRGFRIGITQGWDTRWFAARPADYRRTLLEDLRIRRTLEHLYKDPDGAVARIEIERSPQEVVITIHTARPGVVIGRQGQKVAEARHLVEALTDKKVRIEVQEIERPELEAVLVARSIASQLEKRVSARRAMLRAGQQALQAGALGFRAMCSGRIAGAEIARKEKVRMGRLPLHTLRADIDFAIAEAHTVMGVIGVKVWIYKGDVPMPGERPVEEMAAREFTISAEEEKEEAGAPAQEGPVS